MQALIGKAIQKQYLQFSFVHTASSTNALQAQDQTKESGAKFALSLKQGKIEELPFDSPAVKKALEKKSSKNKTATLAQQVSGRKKDSNKVKEKDSFS